MSSAIEGMKSGLKAFQLYAPSTLVKQLLEVFPHDQVSKIYIERCDRYISSEPDKSWTPITMMTSK